jgi:hypothetical protein
MLVKLASRAETSLRSALRRNAIRHITENSVNAFFFHLIKRASEGGSAALTSSLVILPTQ